MNDEDILTSELFRGILLLVDSAAELTAPSTAMSDNIAICENSSGGRSFSLRRSGAIKTEKICQKTTNNTIVICYLFDKMV